MLKILVIKNCAACQHLVEYQCPQPMMCHLVVRCMTCAMFAAKNYSPTVTDLRIGVHTNGLRGLSANVSGVHVPQTLTCIQNSIQVCHDWARACHGGPLPCHGKYVPKRALLSCLRKQG